MKRDMKAWLYEMLQQEKKKALPVLSFSGVQKLNVTVKEMIADAALQAACMKAVAESTPQAAASVSLMDLSVEAECFGATVHVTDDEVPVIVGSIVNSPEEAESLEIPEVGAGRSGLCVEAIRLAQEQITDRPVFAGIIGPYSLAGRLMDVSEIMICCYEDPDMVHCVLEKVAQFLISYGKAFKEAGANGLVVAEPLAGLLSPDLAGEFSTAYMKQLVDALQDDTFLVVYHNCGNAVLRQVDSILSIGAAVLHFGNAIDMVDMLEKIPGDVMVMGNIDPVGQFKNGTPESIREAATELLTKCNKYPNFVISSGCDIPPTALWENIDAFYEAVEAFYQ